MSINLLSFSSKIIRSIYISTVFILCIVYSGHAAIVDCTVSNKSMVVADTNGNHMPDPGPNPGTGAGNDDAYWTMQYDNEAHVFLINGHGILPEDMPGFHERILYSFGSSESKLTLNETGGHSSAGVDYVNFNDCHKVNMIRTEISKTAGASFFNQVDIFWLTDNPGGPSVLNCIPGNENTLGGVEGYPDLKWNAGDKALSGQLVDTNGDGIYDRAQATINLNVAHPWIPNVLMDNPITYFPSSGDRQYWVMQSLARLFLSNPFTGDPVGPFDIFIPMDGESSTVSCGGTSVLSVSRIAGQVSPAAPVNVPTLNDWGVIIFSVLLLIAGIYFMRKSGMGGRLSGD